MFHKEQKKKKNLWLVWYGVGSDRLSLDFRIQKLFNLIILCNLSLKTGSRYRKVYRKIQTEQGRTIKSPLDIYSTVFHLEINSNDITASNGIFFSTKKCALYIKKCNFVFVS